MKTMYWSISVVDLKRWLTELLKQQVIDACEFVSVGKFVFPKLQSAVEFADTAGSLR
jgi:hypothetical protein